MKNLFSFINMLITMPMLPFPIVGGEIEYETIWASEFSLTDLSFPPQ